MKKKPNANKKTSAKTTQQKEQKTSMAKNSAAKKTTTAEVIEMPQASKSINAATILERSVCLSVSCHYLGNNRKVETEDVVKAANGESDPEEFTLEQTDMRIDGRQFHTTKRLIPTKEITPCMRIFYSVKRELRKLGIQSNRVFGERTFIIPLAAVVKADAMLVKAHADLMAEAALLATTRYQKAVENQREALGKLFDEKDYLTPVQVASAFDLDWTYVSFQAPDKLEHVDRALFAVAKDKHEKKMAEAFDEVRLVLRDQMRTITSEIAKRLAPKPDGQRRAFKSSVFNDLNDFLETFSFRNLTGDKELDAVVSNLKTLTKGIDAQRLRDFDTVRTNVFEQVKAVTAKLDEMTLPLRRAMSAGAEF